MSPHPHTILLLLALLGGPLLTAGPALAAPADDLAAVAEAPDGLAAADAFAATRPDEASLTTLAASDDPELAGLARAQLLRLRDPDLYAHVRQAQPVGTTRDGRPRFVDPVLSSPEAAPALLERILYGDDPAAVQLALLGALPTRDRDWLADMAWIEAASPRPTLRAGLTDLLARSRRPEARPHLMAALADPQPDVRAQAARGLARHAEAGDALLSALSDPTPGVRAAAAWSLGVVGLEAAVTPLTQLTADADAEVRIAAVGALRRIDPARLDTLPTLDALRADPDVRVRRAVGAARP